MVLAIAIGGLFRGTIRQVFSLLGIIAGVIAVGWTSQWVGHHWLGARPAVLFLGLRWLVALLAGLAVASLFDWLGQRIAEMVAGTALGWLDRAGGFVLGAVLGTAWAAMVLIAVLVLAWPPQVTAAVRNSRLGDPLLRQAQHACALGERVLPGSAWLAQRIEAARHARRPGSTF